MLPIKIRNNAGLAFIILGVILVAFIADAGIHASVRERARLALTYKLSQSTNRLSTELSRSIQLARGVIGLVTLKPDLNQDEFSEFANQVVQDSDVIVNIALAPNLVISNVYPLDTNRAALGVDYRRLPEQYDAIERAIETHNIVMAGPLNLVQGGQGLIVRFPIYFPNSEQTDRLWGITSVVIDFNRLLKNAGVADLTRDNRVVIRGQDGTGSSGEVFFGNSETLGDDPVYHNFSLPTGSWQFAIEPRKGWVVEQQMLVFHILLGAISLLVIFSAATLDTELRRRCRAENALREKSEQQEQLFAIVGHELRTPAAAIKMLIEEEQLDQSNAKRKLLLETSNHLINVLDDMRAVTHPDEAINGELTDIVIPDLVASSESLLSHLLNDHGLRVHIQSDANSAKPHPVNAQLLRQIVLNLLKNAAQHSRATDLWIDISSTTENQAEPSIIIEFADNGQGISAEHKETLFSAFQRGKTSVDGAGLGLHVSRKFIQDHFNGDLTYRDRAGGGAVFTLKFNPGISETESQPPTQQPLDQYNPLHGKNILVAEDNKVLQMTIKNAFEKQGASVTVADNGADALRNQDISGFDLYVTDIFMPKMDGYQFTAALRALGIDKFIIGLTAAVIGSEQEQLLNQGANAVLSKPLNMEQLKKLLWDLEQRN